ncbi:MAG TPA: hypothetical protein VGC75_01830 [Candidatus Nitrosocosmicus sp.]
MNELYKVVKADLKHAVHNHYDTDAIREKQEILGQIEVEIRKINNSYNYASPADNPGRRRV